MLLAVLVLPAVLAVLKVKQEIVVPAVKAALALAVPGPGPESKHHHFPHHRGDQDCL